MNYTAQLPAPERAAILEAVLASPGWEIVVDVFDSLVEATREELLGCASANADTVFKLQLRARLAADLRRDLLFQLREMVAAEKRPRAAVDPDTFLPGT